jgi:spore coat polysaccharide biosynthesis protein SpsF
MKSRTVAIIQARMGSSRLPGKVLKTMGSRSVLGYLVDRISKARTVDHIIVATTTEPRDERIILECERHGVAYFRGSEADVLGRYVGAAAVTGADIVVRVTADNPFTDPDSIDRVVDTIAAGGWDYAIESNLPAGTTGEALTRNALRFIDANADTPRWREHVTLYAKENPRTLRCIFLEPPEERRRPDLSFTVDVPDDYLYVSGLSKKFARLDFPLIHLISAADELRSGFRSHNRGDGDAGGGGG